MDKFWRDKIEKETCIPLISRKNNNSYQTKLQLYRNKKWLDTLCPYRGYVSGTSLLDFVCTITTEYDFNGNMSAIYYR